MMLWIELAILLACIVIGARLGGIGLGAMGGIGLAVFVFLFALPPGSPPGTVLGMILAVITALALICSMAKYSRFSMLDGPWRVFLK